MISRFSNNSLGKLQLNSLFRYSTVAVAVAAAQPTVMAEFLINSLGFSNDEALAASQKVTPAKSFRNDPNSVIGYLEKLGLNRPQIKGIVTAYPSILLPDPQKSLEPKIKALQDIGLSGSDMIRVLTSYSSLLCRPLETNVLAPIEYLTSFLGSKELVCKFILRNASLLHDSTVKNLAPTIAYLRKLGCSEKQLSLLMHRNPRYINPKSSFREDIVEKMENNYQISCNSKMLFHFFAVLSSNSTAAIEKKFNVFRSFGWSEENIHVMFRKAPYSVGCSEERLRKVLDYYTYELGYTADYLASRAPILNYSLEKRVKPRIKIMKILKENKLLDEKSCFYPGLKLKDIDFIKRFILPYLDDVTLSVTDLEFLNNYILPHKDEVANLCASKLKLCSRTKKGDENAAPLLPINKIDPLFRVTVTS